MDANICEYKKERTSVLTPVHWIARLFLLSEFTFPSVVSEEVNSKFSNVFVFNPAMRVRTRIEIGLESTYLENRNSSKNLTP